MKLVQRNSMVTHLSSHALLPCNLESLASCWHAGRWQLYKTSLAPCAPPHTLSLTHLQSVPHCTSLNCLKPARLWQVTGKCSTDSDNTSVHTAHGHKVIRALK
mmetsp:Transcript_14453/g.31314  ORF Transcript_14453/g.31314 Transcript_14453/m.31314 type:complete len:103 (+) Transcript_14453:653-961(+)